MVYKNRKEVIENLKRLKYLGSGSQGSVFYDKKNGRVIKIYESFFDEEFYDECYSLNKDDVIRFPGLVNDTYIFPMEAVMLNDEAIGYTSKYCEGNLLADTNPLIVNYNNFIESVLKTTKDTEILSKQGILTYDVIYNIMYGNNKINVIDTDEYSYSNLPIKEIIRKNNYSFNQGIMLFLIDNYFDEFIKTIPSLKEMYSSQDIDIKEFLLTFKKYICEYSEKDIEKLSEAKKFINKKIREPKYIRNVKQRNNIIETY